jgi:orotate phosphoribosyltransferase-like protein
MKHGGPRPGSGRKPANFDHARAIKLKEQGFTYQEIADRFGVSKWSIQWFFRKHKSEQ